MKIVLTFLLAMFAGVSATAFADTYPNRPIKLVVAFAAGSGVDSMARIVAAGLQKELGVPVIVDNRPGGSALIGTAFVAKSPPDGYTLVMAGSATHSSVNALFKNVP